MEEKRGKAAGGRIKGNKPRQKSRMMLVGGRQTGASPDVQEFYAGLFGRLTNEVKHTGSLTRYVGFEGCPAGGTPVRFLGIEVEKIEDIPEGMTAWDLNGDTWTVWEAGSGRKTAVWREKITRRWVGGGPSRRARPIGEFSAGVPLEWSGGGVPGRCDFRVTANAYVRSGAKGCDDDVHLVDYDPSWPGLFTETARWIRDRLGLDPSLRVEHYGSTAIPGMPAKPVIDVLVEIPSFEEAGKLAVPLLNGTTWEYWWYWDRMHMIFIKRKEFMGQRTHHIHMAPGGHELWRGLAFRDYLRSNPGEASRYAALKRELASKYRKDRESYTTAKGAFVREVTEKALRSS